MPLHLHEQQEDSCWVLFLFMKMQSAHYPPRLLWSALIATLGAVWLQPHGGAAAAATRSLCGEGSLGVIVDSLPSLQAAKGHFGKLQAPNLLATQRALFIAQLYGLLPIINRERAREFVTSAQKSHLVLAVEEEPQAEGGAHDKIKPVAADTEKVKAAATPMMFRSVDDLYATILCSQALGLENNMPDESDIIAFLLSLWDETTGLFGKVPGSSGDIRSSAAAMQVAAQQGKRHKFTAQITRIRLVLQNCSHTRNRTVQVCNASQLALFDVPRQISRALPPVSINYFAVLLAGLCDFRIPLARNSGLQIVAIF